MPIEKDIGILAHCFNWLIISLLLPLSGEQDRSGRYKQYLLVPDNCAIGACAFSAAESLPKLSMILAATCTPPETSF